MAEEQEEKQELETKEAEGSASSLEDIYDSLMDYGGFDLFKEIIDGCGALDPESKARKNIFLTSSDKAKERNALKSRLEFWKKILSENEDAADMITAAQENADAADKLLNENLKLAFEETKPLETSYRSVALFFKNTEQDKIRNLTLYNVDPAKLGDMENTLVMERITDELKNCHDRLDLKQNYSLMVLPGYLGSNQAVDKWSKIAYENKVMLITDFLHLDDSEAVIDEFDSVNLAGGEIYKSNAIMTCNYLVGREKYEELGEEEDLFLPPSSALAGKIYSTLIAQPVAGKMHGGLNEITGVKFDLRKSEITELEKRGLVPMVNEWGKVMSMSAKTLYNGNDIGLQTYSVVRVFDYIAKVIIDFLNRQAFVNWTPNVQKDLKKEMSRYLSSIKGYDKIIEDFQIMNLNQDKETKVINLDIHITPFFPAKNFLIRLGGTKGDTADEWMSEITQE